MSDHNHRRPYGRRRCHVKGCMKRLSYKNRTGLCSGCRAKYRCPVCHRVDTLYPKKGKCPDCTSGYRNLSKTGPGPRLPEEFQAAKEARLRRYEQLAPDNLPLK